MLCDGKSIFESRHLSRTDTLTGPFLDIRIRFEFYFGLRIQTRPWPQRHRAILFRPLFAYVLKVEKFLRKMVAELLRKKTDPIDFILLTGGLNDKTNKDVKKIINNKCS